MKKNGYYLLLLVAVSALSGWHLTKNSDPDGGDWPAYRHDNFRSGKTSEALEFPLEELWSYKTAQLPMPAWSEPAKTDYWHRKKDLNPRVNYDKVFHPVSDGDYVFFGSSGNDRVYCLDAASGKLKWSFFTGGPVRLAPLLYQDKIYFGSDDGYFYCLNKSTGILIWKFFAGKDERKVLGNERMISYWPIRTGAVIDQGQLFFCSGLFPSMGTFLFSLDAENGVINWKKELNISPQGYLLVIEDKILVPTGRTTPVFYSKKNGELLENLNGQGGTFATVQDSLFLYGTGDLGQLQMKGLDPKNFTTLVNGLETILTDSLLVVRNRNSIQAFSLEYLKKDIQKENLKKKLQGLKNHLWDIRENDRFGLVDSKDADKKIKDLLGKIQNAGEELRLLNGKTLAWEKENLQPASMVVCENALIVGAKDSVFAFQISSGEQLWTSPVEGNVFGLAVSNGKVIASTDKGNLYSFGKTWFSFGREMNEVSFHGRGNDMLDSEANILTRAEGKKGYCLLLGAGDGSLAFDLARKTKMRVVVLEKDEEKVLKLREKLNNAGHYGERISVLENDLQRLPFNDLVFNLVISENRDDLSGLAVEIHRVLHPFRGEAWFPREDLSDHLKNRLRSLPHSTISEDKDLFVLKKISVRKGGEWTHLYADPGNTACSNDTLEGPVKIQWFGKPGPVKMINRHSRPMSSLFKEGRVFVPANDLVICYDAYNGFPLWERAVPGSRRVGALKDCGHMVVDGDNLFVAVKDSCLVLNPENGELIAQHHAPGAIPGFGKNWGYLSVRGDQLFGSGMKEGASYYDLGRINCDQLEGDFREVISSEYLFSMDKRSGEVLWTYKKGVVLNNTIAVGEDAIYLVESRNPALNTGKDGRIRIDHFCKKNTYLVKLDLKTGAKTWEKRVKFPYEHIMYLSTSDDVVLVSGSFNINHKARYKLFAFDSKDGDLLWNKQYMAGNTQWKVNPDKNNQGGSHGEQWQHPVINGRKVILPPYAFDLITGKEFDFKVYRGGHGCGGMSGSKNYLFARGSNPRMYDLKEEVTEGTRITQVNRPGCWINIIPAGGIVSIPESSSGCTCGYPIQASFAFIPE